MISELRARESELELGRRRATLFTGIVAVVVVAAFTGELTVTSMLGEGAAVQQAAPSVVTSTG
jgi:hypothetical protein